MIEVVGRFDDDPPIFALRLTGDGANQQVSEWLDGHLDVQRIELRLGEGAMLRPDDIRNLSEKHGVAIDVPAEGVAQA